MVVTEKWSSAVNKKKKEICLYSVFRVKLVVARPIWRCVRRRVDLTRVFDMLEGGGEPAELHCSIMSHYDTR